MRVKLINERKTEKKILNVYQKHLLFRINLSKTFNEQIYSVKIKDDFRNSEELEELNSKVKEERLVGILGKQVFLFATKGLNEQGTNTVLKTSEKRL